MGSLVLWLCALAFARAQEQQQVTVELPEDMGCFDIARTAVWRDAKSRFRSVFGEEGSAPFQVAPRETVTKMLEDTVTALKAGGALTPESEGECGYGKLALQLTTFANIEDVSALSEVLQRHEPISSPILTLLLDIPFVATAQAGWPLFGMLAQMSLRKQQAQVMLNDAGADGLDDPVAQQFFQGLVSAMPNMDLGAMAQLSAQFLENEAKGGGPFPLFTAMAAQAAVSPLEQRLESIQYIQQSFKQVLKDSVGLDVVMSTRWPLWPLLHLAVTPLTIAE